MKNLDQLWSLRGSITVVCYGYGVLKIPSSSIDSVLRVRKTIEYTESRSDKNIDITISKYDWYNNKIKGSILTNIYTSYYDGRFLHSNESFVNESISGVLPVLTSTDPIKKHR